MGIGLPPQRGVPIRVDLRRCTDHMLLVDAVEVIQVAGVRRASTGLAVGVLEVTPLSEAAQVREPRLREVLGVEL
jgi:hypothetical protein